MRPSCDFFRQIPKQSFLETNARHSDFVLVGLVGDHFQQDRSRQDDIGPVRAEAELVDAFLVRHALQAFDEILEILEADLPVGLAFEEFVGQPPEFLYIPPGTDQEGYFLCLQDLANPPAG